MIRLISALLLTSLILATGCASTPRRPARINHMVFFKLVDPADADGLIKVCDEELAKLPGLRSYFCGRHFDTDRAKVDYDYHVAFFAGFDSKDDYSAYLDHPTHKAVVAEWGPKFESVMIRDVLDETE